MTPHRIFHFLMLWIVMLLLSPSCTRDKKSNDLTSPAEEVNLRIGAISHLLVPTYPTVQIPNSMVRIYPLTTPGINDNYLASRIFAFPVNIPSHRSGPLSTIMATSRMNSLSPDSLASSYDHDFEISTPYYYSVLLEDPEVWAEYTVTSHGAIFRFRSEQGGQIRLVIRSTGSGLYQLERPGVINGHDKLQKVTQYFYAESDPLPAGSSVFSGSDFKTTQQPTEGQGSGLILDYDLPQNGVITIRAGISFISPVQAHRNAESEVSGKSFEEIKTLAKNIWNKKLGMIKITGGSEDQRRIFYTALYRCFERMINITEDGKYYSAFDGKIHETEDHDFYVDDWSWDTFRSLHPLRTILAPGQESDMINSYILMYEQSGWMPSFPTLTGDMGAMIGHHQADIITDAWLKGIRNFDIERAYEGLRKNAMEGTRVPWNEGPMTSIDKVYLEKGFFPARKPGEPETEPRVNSFEGRQSVAVTLEHSFDDWCLSRLAGSLGKKEDESMFSKRGQNYRLSYNAVTGFMSPRSADGKWIEPFNPISPAGIGGREYFAECNAWTYTWFVLHDIAGLAELMGGKEVAIQRLDRLFDQPIDQSKWKYLGYMPDATGLTGLFTMGNEPAFHIPYIYDLLGTPWKTQKRVKQLMDAWFRNDLMGICGDDDGGAMSSWYVFSAMGFYPICPGIPAYVLGSPVFENININLEGNKIFTIRAIQFSGKNKYIQSARLNGMNLDQPWFTHNDLMKGGELLLQMGPRPNKNWGNKVDPKDFYKY